MSWAHLPPEHFLRTAEQLEPTILGQREAIERNRGLPPDLSHALRDGGFFSLWLPKALGGPAYSRRARARRRGLLARRRFGRLAGGHWHVQQPPRRLSA